MSKGGLKTLGVCLLASIAAIILFSAGPGNILKHVVFSWSEDTEYSLSYSEKAFESVKVGDSESSVISALGVALRSSPTKAYTDYLYSTGEHPDFAMAGTFPDMRHSFTVVHFNEAGIITGAFGQLSDGGIGGEYTSLIGSGQNSLELTRTQIEQFVKVGMTKEEFESRYGEPKSKYSSSVVKWLFFSRSPTSTHYRLRKIGIDQAGRVCEKSSEMYWD